MKAHIKSRREKERELERSEILRCFKMFAFTLCQDFDFDEEKVKKAINLISEYSEELYHDPERWIQVDDYLYDNGVKIFERENIDERLSAAQDIHRENGRKWRQY